MEYQFKSKKEPFIIKNTDGEILYQGIIDTGNEGFIKKIANRADKIQAVEKRQNELSAGQYITELLDSVKAFVEDVFPGDFELIFEKCENNVFAMVEVIETIVKKSGIK